jgi:TolB-like protein/tetratricopeptide (TPR) repeat protein
MDATPQARAPTDMVESRSAVNHAGAAGAGAPIFISYASTDIAVADRVCEFLESEGIACWIAPRNVRAGDFYADAILQGINDCRMLIVILSGASVSSMHVLREVERAGAKNRPLISLRIAPVSLPPALEYFLSASHWLDAGSNDIERALPQLLDAARGHIDTIPGAAPATKLHVPRRGSTRRSVTSMRALLGLSLVLLLALGYIVADKVRSSRLRASAHSGAPAPTAFTPAPHSVAVLPFVNLSGDPQDEYFSDGLSVELLDSLASIRDLQVVARTSSFAFKNKPIEVTEIARRLNVGAVLEGSIRREGQHVRIAANLINATTGFRLWSNSFDRDLTGILKLQTEIATAVTTALRATLLADTVALIELGGTKDPKAFDAYLRGERLVGMPLDAASTRTQISAYDEALRLDPQFAKAHVAKALADVAFASNAAATQAAREGFVKALASARKAVALAPELGEAHSALGFVLDVGFQDYSAAAAEHERALALAPGNSRVLLMSARFLSEIGRSEAARTNAERAVALDPVNGGAYRLLGLIMIYAHHYREAVAAYDHALSINTQAVQSTANRGLALLALGEFAAAQQSCATPPLDWLSHMCLAIALHKLERATDAQAEMRALQASGADENDLAYQFAQVYAQWGDRDQALNWVETAYRVHDPGLLQLKVDFLMDPIRREPRFASILAKMKFPD